MLRALLAPVLLALCAQPALAEERTYFYRGYDYGSQAVFSPLTVFLNRAFDTLQIRPEDRRFWKHSYGVDGANLADNLAAPVQNVERGPGWDRFTRTELLPLHWSTEDGRWIPNYGLHALGGGVTYTTLSEWFAARDVPAPAAWSALTIMSAAFVNEMIENHGIRGPNADAIADLWVFDIAGIVLFSFEEMNEVFSDVIVSADWSLQPGFALPDGTIHNQGSYYGVKIPSLVYRRVHLFLYGGISAVAGISYELDDQHSLSVGGGLRLDDFRNSSRSQVRNVVENRPAAAIFFDRNESLLASLQVADVNDYFIQLNVYPNAFFRTDPGVGLWTVIGKKRQWLVGVSITAALGLGVARGTL